MDGRGHQAWLRWLLWAALGLAWMSAATGAEVSPADARQVRAVITAQLAAFAADDADKAYAYASPAIQQQMQTPTHFMAMVREAYPVVYRTASFSFLTPEWAGDDVVQAVQMTDADGALWLAVYRLEREPDGTWRINGCALQRNEGGAA